MSLEIRRMKSWFDKQKILRFLDEKYDNVYILFDIDNYYFLSNTNQFYYTISDGEVDAVVLVYYSSSGVKDIWGVGSSTSLLNIFNSLDLSNSVVHTPINFEVNNMSGYSSLFKEYCMYLKQPIGNDQPSVRLLGPSDYMEYMKLMVNWNGSRFPKMSVEDFKNNVTYGTIYGYFYEGKILSAASVGAIWKQWFVVSSVFTHPDFRNRGLAKKVISKILYDYSHMETAILFVNVDNKPAINAYSSLGFRNYSENYWIDFNTGLVP